MSATGSILHVCTLGNREGKIERRKKRKRKERKRADQPTGEAISSKRPGTRPREEYKITFNY